MTAPNHTPGPWVVSHFNSSVGRVITRAEHAGRPAGGSVDPDANKLRYMQTIAYVPENNRHDNFGPANAAFIVRACNAHEDLFAWVKGVVDQADAQRKAGDQYCTLGTGMIEGMRAALAKAEDGKAEGEE